MKGGNELDTKHIIMAGIAAVIFAACLFGWIFAKRKLKEIENPTKKQKKKSKLLFVGMIFGGWFLIGVFVTAFSGNKPGMPEVEFNMFSERITLFGNFSLGETTLISLGVTAVIIVLLLLFRFICVPKFNEENPTGIQNALEALAEMTDGLVKKSVGETAAKSLTPYMMSLGLFMIGCAFTELLGLRAPTSDLTCTLSMGLITFFLLNYYGIKKNGILGRLKNMGGAVPAMRPLMIPLKAVSDIAVPVSLACRLFGNMLGGMMVMDMLKGALGGYGSGIPAVAGLYFNLFHPLIQMYIFITLSLTFINEAME